MENELFGKCPIATSQILLRGKWTLLILFHMLDGPIRFNELQRNLPSMTNATLSVQLRRLEGFGLIKRKMYDEMPLRVEYSLSEMGENLRPLFKELVTFGNKYIETMEK